MRRRFRDDERGAALVVALLLGILFGVAGGALLTLSTTETLIGAAYRHVVEASCGAEAGLDRALHDLASTPDWSAVLKVPPANLASTFVDGTTTPRAANGRVLDLEILTLQRQRDSDIRDGPDAYGDDHPHWRLYAHAPLADLAPGLDHAPPIYVVVWVADDGADGDGDPSTDSNGRIVVRAEGFGSRGARRAIEAAVERSANGSLRTVVQREAQ